MKKHNIQLIETISEFIKIKDIWDKLHQSCTFPTIFNSWYWIYTCITSFQYSKICVIIVWENSNTNKTPLFILPLYICRKAVISYAKIIGNEVSDYHNFLINRNLKSADVMYKEIKSIMIKQKISAIEIDQIANQYFNNSILSRKMNRSGLFVMIIPGTSTFYNKTSEVEYHNRNYFKKINRRIQQIQKQQGELISLSSSTDSYLDKFYEFHKERWGSKSIYLTKKNCDFLRNICTIMSQNNQLVFSVATISGEPIALSISFILSNRFYGYLTSYSSKYRKLSPGIVLTYFEYLFCCKKRITYFDLLRGAELYKKRWTPEEIKTSNLNIYANTTFGLLLYLFSIIIFILKRIKMIILWNNTFL